MGFAPKDKASRLDSRPKFKSIAKLLEETPTEYQASVYANLEKQRRTKSQEKKKNNLIDLRVQLKELKRKLAMASSGSKKEKLNEEILKIEAAIKKAPRPKRRWPPVLAGSYESKK